MKLNLHFIILFELRHYFASSSSGTIRDCGLIYNKGEINTGALLFVD